LVHTSPPYNINRNYKGFRDSSAIEEYRSFLSDVLGAMAVALRPGGSVFWQTGYTTRNDEKSNTGTGRIVPLDSLVLPIFEELGFILWDRIIWNYFGSMAFKSKFTNRHETILWFVKDGGHPTQPIFNVDAVRERSVSYDGRNHILGRNPGNVWQAQRVAYGSTGQTSHIAVFPEEVSEKIIRCCSAEGELVVDPFAGSGTTCKAALTLGRQFLGCEISEPYANEANERLGLWASREVDNLALGIIVIYGFRRKLGTLALGELQMLLEAAGAGGFEARLRDVQNAVAEIVTANRVTRSLKRRKYELWEKYDHLIDDYDPTDPIIAADQALSFCFAHRKRWNGVKRYLSAGLVLRDLCEEVLGVSEQRRRAFLRDLCAGAPTRFRLSRTSVELLRTDSGLGCDKPLVWSSNTSGTGRVAFDQAPGTKRKKPDQQDLPL